MCVFWFLTQHPGLPSFARYPLMACIIPEWDGTCYGCGHERDDIYPAAFIPSPEFERRHNTHGFGIYPSCVDCQASVEVRAKVEQGFAIAATDGPGNSPVH
jgi:hypothetical protein